MNTGPISRLVLPILDVFGISRGPDNFLKNLGTTIQPTADVHPYLCGDAIETLPANQNLTGLGQLVLYANTSNRNLFVWGYGFVSNNLGAVTTIRTQLMLSGSNSTSVAIPLGSPVQATVGERLFGGEMRSSPLVLPVGWTISLYTSSFAGAACQITPFLLVT